MTEPPMHDAKVDQALAALARLEARLESECGVVKKEIGGVKQDLAQVKQQQIEMVAAFRAHWADMSNLYRTVREEQKQFEERMETKLTRVNQSILALRDSLE